VDGQFDSIVHVVSKHAREKSARDAIIFLARGEAETERVSYRDLDGMIASHAAGLAASGLAGQPVVIAMPAGAAFVALFLAALRAGAVAIPVPFPDTQRSASRLASILHDASPSAIVTANESVARLEAIAEGTRVIGADTLQGTALAPPALAAGDPAFVQYTSGSTRAPKGIVITHGNLAANQQMIQTAFGTGEDAMGVNWLPHFHDMGLIGTILHPLFLGGTAVLMPPRAFIQKPMRWLRAIEKYRSDVAGGPCFGFELCARMISPEQARTLDLSSWKVAFCGAEPIRAAVLDAFAGKFAAAGFSQKALLPCYGLAEATLIVSAAKRGGGLSQKEIRAWGTGVPRAYVSCGAAAEGSAIVLRDEKGAPDRSGGSTGEICVGGAHLSPGYWDGARRGVAPFPGLFTDRGTAYLPTGDIGAFVDAELYPIDRLRDFFILYGAKIHAADIEATVRDESADIRSAAAFAVDDGTRERLVVLCEIDRRALATMDIASLTARLCKRISETHGVVPAVHFAAFGVLPRTSSGKIQRPASRIKFLSGELDLHRVEANATSPISAPESHAE